MINTAVAQVQSGESVSDTFYQNIHVPNLSSAFIFSRVLWPCGTSGTTGRLEHSYVSWFAGQAEVRIHHLLKI